MRPSRLAVATAVLAFVTLSTETLVAHAQPQNGFDRIEFRVADTASKMVPSARIVVVGDDGKVLANGLTNSLGQWAALVKAQPDPRFGPSVQSLDTVTAIAFATGYNEHIVFEVPVRNNAVQPIILYPIQSQQRNEPTAAIGNLHRQDIMSIINKYAQELKLKRQPAIPGDPQNAPWGPQQH